jgi:uncharacterized protein (DUF302 family)
MATEGIITLPSSYSVRETIDRLISVITSKDLLVFARIDHAKNAKDAGLELRPTELLIFGHGKGGTPLMQDQPLSGLDLPLRALAWQDADGKVWLGYNSAAWIAKRHQLGTKSAAAVAALDKALAALAATAGGL